MKTSRSIPVAVAVVLAVSLGSPLSASRASSAVPARPGDRTLVHVLNRIGFGPRAGDIERVRQMGLAAYIDSQLHPERISDDGMAQRLANLETLTKTTRELADEYFLPALRARQQAKRAAGADASSADDRENGSKPRRTPEQMEALRRQRDVLEQLSEQKILRAAYSDRQLEEVLTDFWFNHFNVFAGKGLTRLYVTEYERDAIRPHVLGKFRDLLEATAKSPAMLFYLDNWQSVDPSSAPRTGQNPRARTFARRADGFGRQRPMLARPPRPAGQEQPASARPKRGLNENYGRELMELHTLGVDGGFTQQDVVAVARAFTGWTIETPRRGGGFTFERRLHDPAEKMVLGHRIDAGGGERDGEAVLDLLAHHPATAHFIATELVRRFVSDTPPPSLIDRAAARFRDTDGDLREVMRTILTSPEFFAPDAYRAKVKTPFEFVVSSVRASGADVANALPLVQGVRQLGMPLYMCQPPTGYKDTADAWVNTGALINRMNFAVALIGGRLPGVSMPAPGSGTGSPQDVRRTMASQILAGDLSPATEGVLAKAADAKQVATLLLGSPEFQRR